MQRHRFLEIALLTACLALPAHAESEPPRPPPVTALAGFERTPPRLAYTDGAVSFWRMGASDWAPARLNTALAAGDQLYAGAGANLELQVGPRAFVRAGENSQLGLESLEPDFLQFRVASGTVSLDLRALQGGQTFELDTPNAAFSVEHPGYYRVEVEGDETRFVSRRGGRAIVTPAGGEPAVVAPSEETIVRGTQQVALEAYSAPALDAWDRWNYERTDQQLEARSDRFLPSGVYGAEDLDRYGQWRLVPTYGAVWIPTAVSVGWVPYSDGIWMADPYYGWTWVDAAPWGWAPFHYGRWVYIDTYWAWAPGPVVAHAYWAPALVAFFGDGAISVGIRAGIAAPPFGWVALGWGEPIVPWWGPRPCLGVPHWAGWGGPHIVNGIVVHHTTGVSSIRITTYHNRGVKGAVVVVPRNRFGRDRTHAIRVHGVDVAQLRPLHGALPVRARAGSPYGAPGRAARPPRHDLSRRVYALREPDWRKRPSPQHPSERARRARSEVAAPRLAPAPPARRESVSRRPPFGRGGEVERGPAQPPPRFEEVRRRTQAEAAPAPPRPAREANRRAGGPSGRPFEAPGAAGRGPRAERSRRATEPRAASRRQAPPPSGTAYAARPLPGEPAERVMREGPRSQRRRVAPNSRTRSPGAVAGPLHGTGSNAPRGRERHYEGSDRSRR